MRSRSGGGAGAGAVEKKPKGETFTVNSKFFQYKLTLKKRAFYASKKTPYNAEKGAFFTFFLHTFFTGSLDQNLSKNSKK